jgi:hypothetical protein
LEVLRLNGNKLTSLPDELARLDKLIWLLIHDNPELDAFPSCYVALRSLTRCLTHGNPELPSWMARDCQTRQATQAALEAAKQHFAPLENACRRAVYAFLIVARMRDPIMRRCLGRDVSKLIARLVWLSRGSARVWTRCMTLDVQPYYLHRNAF